MSGYGKDGKDVKIVDAKVSGFGNGSRISLPEFLKISEARVKAKNAAEAAKEAAKEGPLTAEVIRGAAKKCNPFQGTCYCLGLRCLTDKRKDFKVPKNPKFEKEQQQADEEQVQRTRAKLAYDPFEDTATLAKDAIEDTATLAKDAIEDIKTREAEEACEKLRQLSRKMEKPREDIDYGAVALRRDIQERCPSSSATAKEKEAATSTVRAMTSFAKAGICLATYFVATGWPQLKPADIVDLEWQRPSGVEHGGYTRDKYEFLDIEKDDIDHHFVCHKLADKGTKHEGRRHSLDMRFMKSIKKVSDEQVNENTASTSCSSSDPVATSSTNTESLWAEANDPKSMLTDLRRDWQKWEVKKMAGSVGLPKELITKRHWWPDNREYYLQSWPDASIQTIEKTPVIKKTVEKTPVIDSGMTHASILSAAGFAHCADVANLDDVEINGKVFRFGNIVHSGVGCDDYAILGQAYDTFPKHPYRNWPVSGVELKDIESIKIVSRYLDRHPLSDSSEAEKNTEEKHDKQHEQSTAKIQFKEACLKLRRKRQRDALKLSANKLAKIKSDEKMLKDDDEPEIIEQEIADTMLDGDFEQAFVEELYKDDGDYEMAELDGYELDEIPKDVNEDDGNDMLDDDLADMLDEDLAERLNAAINVELLDDTEEKFDTSDLMACDIKVLRKTRDDTKKKLSKLTGWKGRKPKKATPEEKEQTLRKYKLYSQACKDQEAKLKTKADNERKMVLDTNAEMQTQVQGLSQALKRQKLAAKALSKTTADLLGCYDGHVGHRAASRAWGRVGSGRGRPHPTPLFRVQGMGSSGVG